MPQEAEPGRAYGVAVTVGEAAVEQRGAILAGLVAFNAAQVPQPDGRALCVAITDEDGRVAGGLFGRMTYDWLAIELLFVPEELRQQQIGTQLLKEAEKRALANGCIGAWLDTFSFQARGFYEKHGYSIAGSIPDHPIGGARYFMLKRWSPAA